LPSLETHLWQTCEGANAVDICTPDCIARQVSDGLFSGNGESKLAPEFGNLIHSMKSKRKTFPKMPN
jgi:hypothetical protein